MDSKQREFAGKVRAHAGDRVLVTDPDLIAPYLTDWRGRWTGRVAGMLEPRSTADVAAILSIASDMGQALSTQGGNSSMVGGATPGEDGDEFILSMRKMNHIRSIDGTAKVAIAEAGVVLETLHGAAAERGLRFPLTLGAKGTATIGGLISTNAGGTQVLKFGTMRGLVEGIEAVLPDGKVHDGLKGLKKDNRGFNLDQLLIGAEGVLGVVTAARLKLVDLPGERATALVGLDSPKAALSLLRSLQATTDRVEGFELMPQDSLVAGLEQLGMASPLGSEQPWYALIEATGAGAKEELRGLLAAALGEGRIADATIAANDAQSEALWHLRDSLSDADKVKYGLATQHDISVPVDGMPAFLDEVKAKVEAQWPGSWASGYGHLGDGNIHLHVRAMDRASDDWREREGAEIERFVHDMVMAHGGSISAEHGIGRMKRGELARLGEPARLMALRAIKAALDPKNILNRGRLIP
ncbi:FAD-binding oxidoreductase [Sphingomicrobium flavum]|uniref:FAD-binding oxidoreductase n=1 Tax=Sphingomicrobium flavum TaxID=1229164 RepID=UPI0021AE0E9B|nr:FAD-binding oxidoreductase [Sphingomicrobium flavum]